MWAAIVLAVHGAPPPDASRRLAAELHLREAGRLARSGRHAEACVELEESLKQWTRARTQLDLGICEELTGFPGTAWHTLRAAQRTAHEDGEPQVEAEARSRQVALERRAGTFLLRTGGAAALPGFAVTVDGAPVAPELFDVPRTLNPPLLTEAAHRLVVTVQGRERWTTTFRIAPGAVVRVDVPPLKTNDALAAASGDRALRENSRLSAPGALVVSLGSSTAIYRQDGETGSVTVPSLNATYDFTPRLTAYVKQSFAISDPTPALGPSGSTWADPLLGARYKVKLNDVFAIVPSLEARLPFGGGGGNAPPAGARAAADVATFVDPAFTPNYLALTSGATLAFNSNGVYGMAGPKTAVGFRTKGEEVDKERLDVYLATLYFKTLTTSTDRDYRTYWYAETGVSVSVGPIVLTPSYGRLLGGQFPVQYVGGIIDVSF
jgi:hypothetical protein